MSSDLSTLLGPVDQRVHRRLIGEGVQQPLDDASLAELIRSEDPLLGVDGVASAVTRLQARIVGVGELQPLLADPEVTDVLVNGPGVVWVERAGRLERSAVVVDAAAIDLLIERVVGRLGLRADRTTPIVDARLEDGSRVHVVLPPLAVDGPYVTVRRFAATAVPLAGLCSPAVAALLEWAVHSEMNLVVCGGTGAGKTTLLNTLCGYLPPGERVVTIEDAAELRLPGAQVIRLESRPASPDGLAAVPIRELVRAALRMRPDRIVVGEVRGPEAVDLLQAMNTGHDGSLSTCHANSPADGLRRIETMSLMSGGVLPLNAVREQIAAAVDLVVQVARMHDGRRAVVAVAEVCPDAEDPRRVRHLVRHGAVADAPTRPARRPDSPPPP